MKKTYLIFLLLSLCSCINDYLDAPPSKSSGIVITTVDELQALLDKNCYSGGATLDNNFASILSSDCFDVNIDYYDAGFKDISNDPESYQLACWEMSMTKSTNENTSMWTANYESIYLANLILSYVDKVSGDENLKKVVKARAHLLRAYNYMELANYYCMPYGPNTLDEPGLPIKSKTSYDEDVNRGTLKATYEFIEKDVLEAINLDVPLMNKDVRLSWKETGATANALAARFYLSAGNYEKGAEYAAKALEYGGDIADFNDPSVISEAYVMSLADMSMVKVSTWWNPDNYTNTFSVDHDRAFYKKDNFYLMSNIWGIPSAKLLNSYDHDYDMRYRLFIVNEFQKIYFMGLYASFFSSDVPGYGTFDSNYLTGPNVAEMMLTQAECLARKGDYTQAMKVLNKFRSYRMDKRAPSSVINLTASGKDEAVRLIMDERMREFPFSLRWNDIRRCNFNDDSSDDVTITRTFYEVGQYAINLANTKTYTLAPSSRNYPVAIPNSEIVSSDGAIEQNMY